MDMIKSDILNIIAEEALVDIETLKLDKKLDELGIDSIAVIGVMYDVEEKYNIEIDDSEIAVDQTLGDMLDLMINKIQASEGQG